MRRLSFDIPMLMSVLTVLGMILATVGTWPPVEGLAVLRWPGLALAYGAGGLPASWTALSALWRQHILDIDLLMVVAAIAAAIVGAPFEGAVLLTLFSVSTTLEHQALGRARRAVEALMALRPETAFRKNLDGSVIEVPAAELAVGDVVILRPGARVPADGVILQGRGGIDEANITGESMPVSKAPGQQVFEATVNLDGILEVTIARTIGDSTIARMIRLVTEAQEAKAPSERFSAWFGQRYTVAVLLGAVLAFVVFYWLGRDWEPALYKAATLLVAASPCAVVISVPAAILSALSAAARGGVLFKGGAALERLASVTAFAFDKTGTLTTGRAEVTSIEAVDGDEDGFLALLAGIEAHSEHPIAGAIRREAEARGLVPPELPHAAAIPSEGIIAGEWWAGNARMLARQGLVAPDGHEVHDQTMIWAGKGGQLLGQVRVADRPRESSAAGLEALRGGGVRRLVMMTGDRRAVAIRIGRELGFEPDDIAADLLPDDKVRLVADLAERGSVAFVGDGVNDAAALARADVGIAMGVAGSEVALQAADVALLSDDMARLAEAQRLARRTAGIIRQNLIFALGAMVLLVIGGLFFNMPLPLAVLGHEGGTVLVVLNGLRLLADPIRGRS